MSLTALYEAYAHPKQSTIFKKIAGACLVAARDIKTEPGGTANHANRLTWAAAAKANPKANAREMVVRVLHDATIAADVENAADSQVQDVVNGLIDTYATG